MQEIVVMPVGFVKNERKTTTDGGWGDLVSEIRLAEDIPTEALEGIEEFSHVEVLFHLDRAISSPAFRRSPRGNPNWPSVGVFAQRGKDRPNRLGTTIVRLLQRRGRTLVVANLDAVDGTPVLDVKPVMREFLPLEEVHQPGWASELMDNYWFGKEENGEEGNPGREMERT